jgi:DNA-binding transcriptional LysR family regulator
MDRLASITAFVRVAETGGFSAAARHLNVSTTTVSGQVQALENSLGVRLLNRTTRRVGLTDAGREYYERCAQILHELAEADEAAGALQVTPRGRLRVYCHQGLSRFIAPVVTRLLGEYPNVSVVHQFEIMAGSTERLALALRLDIRRRCLGFPYGSSPKRFLLPCR